MIERFKIGQGLTAPSLRGTVERENDDNSDISAGTAVFRMWDAATKEVVINDAAAVILGAKLIEYVWQAGDTDTAGDYEGVFIVTHADSTTELLPGGAYGEPDAIPITIVEVPSA